MQKYQRKDIPYPVAGSGYLYLGMRQYIPPAKDTDNENSANLSFSFIPWLLPFYKCNVAEYAIHRTLSKPVRAAKQRTEWVVVNAMAGLS